MGIRSKNAKMLLSKLLCVCSQNFILTSSNFKNTEEPTQATSAVANKLFGDSFSRKNRVVIEQALSATAKATNCCTANQTAKWRAAVAKPSFVKLNANLRCVNVKFCS